MSKRQQVDGIVITANEKKNKNNIHRFLITGKYIFLISFHLLHWKLNKWMRIECEKKGAQTYCLFVSLMLMLTHLAVWNLSLPFLFSFLTLSIFFFFLFKAYYNRIPVVLCVLALQCWNLFYDNKLLNNCPRQSSFFVVFFLEFPVQQFV